MSCNGEVGHRYAFESLIENWELKYAFSWWIFCSFLVIIYLLSLKKSILVVIVPLWKLVFVKNWKGW